jgi:hypothetical protein
MMDLGGRNAFILGCERSGSTWVSNVLDSSPEVEFFMEPFADYAGMFPGFPSRNLYVDHNSDTLVEVVEHGYPALKTAKYPFFYKRAGNLYWKQVDRIVLSLLGKLGRWSGLGIPSRAKKYELLNMNLKDIPISGHSKKIEIPTLTVIKELRMNFKIGLLQRVFPEAKYIIVVRHPGAQLMSIMRLFDMGRLGELRRSLLSLYAYLSCSNRFEKYATYLKCLDGQSGMREMLLLWWLVSYETAIEDCKLYGVDYLIVYNDCISKAPEAEFRKVYSFLKLDYSEEVSAFVCRSSMGSERACDAIPFSPINTIRDSYNHSSESILGIDNEIKIGIFNLYERFEVCDELRCYMQ